MTKIWALLFDPFFWFVTVFLAIVLSVIANFVYDAISNLLRPLFCFAAQKK